MGIFFSILYVIAFLICIWQLDKVSRENKQLHQKVDLLQEQLIEQLNQKLKTQDNFNTDPVE